MALRTGMWKSVRLMFVTLLLCCLQNIILYQLNNIWTSAIFHLVLSGFAIARYRKGRSPTFIAHALFTCLFLGVLGLWNFGKAVSLGYLLVPMVMLLPSATKGRSQHMVYLAINCLVQSLVSVLLQREEIMVIRLSANTILAGCTLATVI